MVEGFSISYKKNKYLEKHYGQHVICVENSLSHSSGLLYSDLIPYLSKFGVMRNPKQVGEINNQLAIDF